MATKREKVFLKSNGRCIYCGCKLEFNNFQMEHIKPKSSLKKDYDNIDNLFPSCSDCNNYKHTLDIEQFRNKIYNINTEKIVGRIFNKYYKKQTKKPIFYFEKVGIDIYGKRSKMD